MEIFAVHLDAVLSLVHSNVISQRVNRMTKMLMEPEGLSLESFLFLSFCFFPSSLYVGKLQNLLSVDRKKCVNVPTSSEFLESSIH